MWLSGLRWRTPFEDRSSCFLTLSAVPVQGSHSDLRSSVARSPLPALWTPILHTCPSGTCQCHTNFDACFRECHPSRDKKPFSTSSVCSFMALLQGTRNSTIQSPIWSRSLPTNVSPQLVIPCAHPLEWRTYKVVIILVQ